MPATSNSPLDGSFDDLVNDILKDWHVPGLSISVVHGEETWSKAYGFARLSGGTGAEAETKTTPDTLFYAASTTKAQLCAVWSVYMHSEANQSKPKNEQINWCTPLVDIIGEDFILQDRVQTAHVTLEDALAHRSGLPRHDLCYGKEGPNTARAMTRHLRHLPLKHEVRAKWEYCNIMYAAASHALETITGKPLREVFREWLWMPLGMESTYLGYGEAARAVTEESKVLARSHYWTKMPGSSDYADGELREQEYIDFPEISGAGEVISTADDYARWTRCLLSPASLPASPLTEAMIKELWTARAVVAEESDMQAPFDGGMLNYALGWFVSSYRGYKCLWHPGGIIGAGSLVMLVPELGWGMSFFGNGNDVGAKLRSMPFALLDRVMGVPEGEKGGFGKVEEAVMRQYGKLRDGMLEPKKKTYPSAPPQADVPLTLLLEEYAGTYRSQAYSRLTFSVKERDDGIKVLFFFMDNKTWPTVLELEHVNAEIWLGTSYWPDGPLRTAFRAESKVGVDGKVQGLGIAMEASLPEHLIWFERDAVD